MNIMKLNVLSHKNSSSWNLLLALFNHFKQVPKAINIYFRLCCIYTLYLILNGNFTFILGQSAVDIITTPMYNEIVWWMRNKCEYCILRYFSSRGNFSRPVLKIHIKLTKGLYGFLWLILFYTLFTKKQ